MQMKFEWNQFPGTLGDLSQDLDDVLPSDLEIFPDLLDLEYDEDLCKEFEELNSLVMEDLSWPDARELRNHDCMWAGLCVNEKHDKDSLKHEKTLSHFAAKPLKRPQVVAPTSSRSVLITKPINNDRPDTPLSENEYDILEIPPLSGVLEDLCPVGPTEVTGQICKSTPPPTPPMVQQQHPYLVRPPPPAVTEDHCYFSTIPEGGVPDTVKTDYLGVQTPSDSEEEIDVETVVSDPRKMGRSSNTGNVLPNSPSVMDRHQLQMTVASAMNGSRRGGGCGSSSSSDVNTRYLIDSSDRTLDACRRRAAGRKRRLSSDEYVGEYGRKSVKRKQYRKYKVGKSKRRRKVYVRNSGSSDSEFDSTERRSMHNNMERQRRIDLRNAFEELRLLLPDTMDREKAAKVVILNSGAQFCADLEHIEKKLVAEKAAMKRHQERLREELSRLRRSLAMRR